MKFLLYYKNWLFVFNIQYQKLRKGVKIKYTKLQIGKLA